MAETWDRCVACGVFVDLPCWGMTLPFGPPPDLVVARLHPQCQPLRDTLPPEEQRRRLDTAAGFQVVDPWSWVTDAA